MEKIKMGQQQFLIPKPVLLVGTVVNDKPNFITVSWAGITSENPPTMFVAIRNIRYSLKGVQQNKTFSINIPSADMVAQADYCGTVSGSEVDKIDECKFKLFYGNLKNAPLIEQCPINIECEVSQIIEIGDHSLVIGEVVESYVTGTCIINGIPDIRKIDPLGFCTLTSKSMGYYKIGEFVAPTNSGGKETKKE